MLKFKLVQRKDMTKGAAEGAKLFYPQLVSNGKVSFERLCEEVAEQSSLTSGDIKNCVDRLIFCLVSHLREGRGVDCGDLGSFRIALRSAGTATEEGYETTTKMRSPSVVYTPGKKLKDMRATGFKFERISKTATTSESGGEEERPGEL